MPDYHHLHLVSDATGETVGTVVRACSVQFRQIETIEHAWTMVRTALHMDRVLAGIAANPGPVLYTMVDGRLRRQLTDGCARLALPCVSILDPVIAVLANHYGVETEGRPGAQHEMDAEYFERIAAMDFALAHDDGAGLESIEKADVILLGVSRTSKTPTTIYLANRGIKAANYPLVPGVPLPREIEAAQGPLIVGLTKDPARLVDIRRNRLRLLGGDQEAEYVDLDAVRKEVADARRLYSRFGWPVVDVTRRSIEETAAAIITRLGEHRAAQKALQRPGEPALPGEAVSSRDGATE